MSFSVFVVEFMDLTWMWMGLQHVNSADNNSTGSGQYMRMKSHMAGHVDRERHTMFTASAEAVKLELANMCREVDDLMASRTDEVYMLLRRDYMTVIGGAQLPHGAVMPKWERDMRRSVAQLVQEWIHGTEEKVEGVKEEDDSGLSAGERDVDVKSERAVGVKDEPRDNDPFLTDVHTDVDMVSAAKEDNDSQQHDNVTVKAEHGRALGGENVPPSPEACATAGDE